MANLSSTRVVITGIGLCTPLGLDRESTWRQLLAGQTGLRWLDDERRWAGGPIALKSENTGCGKVTRLAEHVAAEAWQDSGLPQVPIPAERRGCVFGTSKGELHDFLTGAVTRDSAADWTTLWPAATAAQLAGNYRCLGPVVAPVAACATGLVACLQAAELIRSDRCDVVLAGSSDASLFPAVIESFRRLGVLAQRNADPAGACRPFDRHRSGFLIGEGAACLILERYDHARKRGARCYAEWLGGRLGADPSGLTQIDESGATLARFLQDLRRDCGRNPDLINLHGTATPVNDAAECRAIRQAFHASAQDITCSGMKGGLGHLLGASGSVELALTILSLRDQVIPPTVNLRDPDPACDLNFVVGRARRQAIRTAYKISSGFGGHVAIAAVSRCATDG